MTSTHTHRYFTADRLFSLSCILIWMLLSSVVIMFNKWILDRFPFSITLTTWHMLFGTIATQILARTTSLIDRSVEMSTGMYLRAIVPIGMCFSMSLIMSNMTYLYLSMAFIQMLKAVGPVATLLACWSVGLRNPEPSRQVLFTVCVIVGGVMISSFGEMRFVFIGVLLQGVAIVFEAYKNALQQCMLNGKFKMSSMTLLYYSAPACTIINSLFIIAFEAPALRVSKPSHVGIGLFFVNGMLTFGLNIASVTVIKRMSSLVLTLSGIPKAIMLVCFDVVVYHSSMSWLQVFGFGIAGVGTYRYSLIKDSKVASILGKRVDDPNDETSIDGYPSTIYGNMERV